MLQSRFDEETLPLQVHETPERVGLIRCALVRQMAAGLLRLDGPPKHVLILSAHVTHHQVRRVVSKVSATNEKEDSRVMDRTNN